VWLPTKESGEYAVDLGAKVKYSEAGQIQLVDDDGNVSCCTNRLSGHGMER